LDINVQRSCTKDRVFSDKVFVESWFLLCRAQLVQLGEKVIQLDRWKEDKLTQMMTQLQKELAEKEEALENL
jgi:hypothetical protein